MQLRKILTLLLGLFLTFNVYAWSAPAHRIIAQIAYDNLQPDVKKQVSRLNSLLDKNYGYQRRFESASVWADQLVMRDITAFNDWHYINIPFSPDHTALPPIKTPNLVWAINEAHKVLKSDKSMVFEKALFLRFLQHLVADAHQPLHCITRVTKAHPKGDEGGNLYMIQTPEREKLHSYWDKALGLFDRYYLIDAKDKRRLVQDYARMLQRHYPKESLKQQIEQNDPSVWAKESFQLAKDFVYTVPEDTAPTEGYIKQGRAIAEERIILAGYRLAMMLNTAFAAQ